MVKYKVSAVSYLNTIPFIYGLKQSKLMETIDLSLDYPAICADKLIRREVDIALIPVVAISQLENPYIISDYCIGSDGEVDTVCLYSDVPIQEIKSILNNLNSPVTIFKTLLLKLGFTVPSSL